MSKLPGIALVVAGLGMAAYALPLTTGVSNSAAAIEEIRPPQVMLEVVEAPLPPAWQTTYQPAAREPHAVSPPANSVPSPKRVAVAEVPPRMPIAQAEWAPPASQDRISLAREIQRHLKRVGCYDGEVTGVWSPSVRRAMKSFTERMNATLPVDEPDFVLLAMVERHGSQACGRPCAPGQSDDTRCVPSAGVVAAAKMRPPSAAIDTHVAASPNVAMPLVGRMALAGPKAESSEETGPLAVPTPSAPTGNAAKAAPRVDKSHVSSQHRDRQRSRSPASKTFPAWARNAFGM